MLREKIIKELNNRGYEAIITDTMKNGVEYHGVTIGTGNIRPTIYIDSFKENNIHKIVDTIIEMYKDEQEKALQFDVKSLMDWEQNKYNLQVCVQKQSDEDIVKRNFFNLEQYVRVIVNTNDDDSVGSFKVAPGHLAMFGVNEDVLFDTAWKCTKPTLTEFNMIDIMAEMMGITAQDILEQMGDAPSQIVLGNQSKLHGAIAMCDIDLLSKIANRYECDLVILPSSIHEVIVTPITTHIDVSDFDDMVREVNNSQVSPEEQLSDHAYIFHRDTKMITY